ncbi:MAG TPA: nitrate- and nitrite sensing domain-containing protein, partial [Actinoplanes sp.]|nr:nitrate- and nitrite sensing domain-containing protein [Actinoplanes sp.]
MSKRPKTANAVMSRLRRPSGRLRDLPIWSKLGLIMLVPTLATILVGVNGLIDHIDEASNAERSRTLAVLSQVSGELVDHLQNERSFGVMSLSAPDAAGRAEALKLYSAEGQRVDAAARPYAQQRASLSDLPSRLTEVLARVDSDLEAMPVLRKQVVDRVLPISLLTERYRVLVANLLALRDAAAQLAGDPNLNDRMRAAAAVARVKEFTSQQRAVGHEIIGTRELLPQLRRSFIATETGHDQAAQQMEATATDAERELYRAALAAPRVGAANAFADYQDAKRYINYLGARVDADISDIAFDASDWDGAMIGYASLIRGVEAQLDKQIVAEATTLRDNVQR